VIFGRNDLVQDAPISHVDLLLCRNTLMYFNAEAQSRILGGLHFALNPEGLLFLGKAEMLLSHGQLFAPVDLSRRFLRRREAPTHGDRRPVPVPSRDALGATEGELSRLRREAMLAAPLAQLALGADGRLAMVNRTAERVLGVDAREMGRLGRTALVRCHDDPPGAAEASSRRGSGISRRRSDSASWRSATAPSRCICARRACSATSPTRLRTASSCASAARS
jgi:PAS domain-containing protein